MLRMQSTPPGLSQLGQHNITHQLFTQLGLAQPVLLMLPGQPLVLPDLLHGVLVQQLLPLQPYHGTLVLPLPVVGIRDQLHMLLLAERHRGLLIRLGRCARGWAHGLRLPNNCTHENHSRQ
jgi:hypothetical protein